MSSLFSKPDIPKPVQPPPPKQEDMTAQNAANAERLRRMRALGKQQSIFAGDLSAVQPPMISSRLGGGM